MKASHCLHKVCTHTYVHNPQDVAVVVLYVQKVYQDVDVVVLYVQKVPQDVAVVVQYVQKVPRM